MNIIDIIFFFIFVLAFALTWVPPILRIQNPWFQINLEVYRKLELAAIILWIPVLIRLIMVKIT